MVPSSKLATRTELLSPTGIQDMTVHPCLPNTLLLIAEDSMMQLSLETGDTSAMTDLAVSNVQSLSTHHSCTIYGVSGTSHVIYIYDEENSNRAVFLGTENYAGVIDGAQTVALLTSPKAMAWAGGRGYISSENSADLRVWDGTELITQRYSGTVRGVATWSSHMFALVYLSNGKLKLYEDQIEVTIPITRELNSDGPFSSPDTAFDISILLYGDAILISQDVMVLSDDTNSAFKIIDLKHETLTSVCYKSTSADQRCSCVEGTATSFALHSTFLYYVFSSGLSQTIMRLEVVNVALPDIPQNWRNSSHLSGTFITGPSTLCKGAVINQLSDDKHKCVLQCAVNSECVSISKLNGMCSLHNSDYCMGNQESNPTSCYLLKSPQHKIREDMTTETPNEFRSSTAGDEL